MKALLISIAILALAVPANAGYVRLFFTSSNDLAGLSDTTHLFDDTDGSKTDGTSYALNGNVPAVGVPTIDPSKGEYLYLWLMFVGETTGRAINGINIVANDQAFNGGRPEVDRGIYLGDDENGGGSGLRWNNGSKTTDAVTLVSVDTPGVQNLSADGWLYQGGDQRVALLGAVKPGAGSYDLHLGLGTNGIHYVNNDDHQNAPMVRFGSDDEEWDGSVRHDGPDYYWSSDADAVVTPEPAGIALIAFVAFGFRRGLRTVR